MDFWPDLPIFATDYTPFTMKKLAILTFLLSATISLNSCEKAELENGKEPEEQHTGDGGGWIEEVGDGEDDGFDTGSVVDVATFRNNTIGRQVWLKGYIVGAATGARNKKKYEFEPPFTLHTAILLADDPAETSTDNVVPIQLQQQKYRAMLNLEDNPDNKGRRIAIFGLQEEYLGMPGIKTIDAFELDPD